MIADITHLYIIVNTFIRCKKLKQMLVYVILTYFVSKFVIYSHISLNQSRGWHPAMLAVHVSTTNYCLRT